MRDVYITGTSMTSFGRHGVGSGRRLAVEAARGALAQADITFADVDLMVGGTAHPLSPRPVFVGRELGMTGVPILHIVNASATGLSVVHEAFHAIGAGRADTVLAVAYDAPESDIPTERIIASEGHFAPVVSYALLARERMNRLGTTPEHLAMVAAKNWNYARQNPFAARQASEEVTVEAILGSRMVADPLTAKMVTPWCEGAAAVVVSAEPVPGAPSIRISASALASTRYLPGQVLEGAIGGPPELGSATAARVLEAAGISRADLDIVQVHDGFAVEELDYYESLGFVAEGEADKVLAAGGFGPGSRERFGLPEFSTDGGLIARGHPGAPTGTAQVVETVRRLSTTSDRVGLCHLLGAGGVCAALVVTRD